MTKKKKRSIKKTKTKKRAVKLAKRSRASRVRKSKKTNVRKSGEGAPRRSKHNSQNMIRSSLSRKSLVRPISKKPAYVLNTDFGSFYELRDLILKSLPAEKDNMTERLNKIGKIKLAIISGVFINKDNLDPLITDLLIVGDYLDNRKLRLFLKFLEAEVGREIKYSVMDKDEFQYRLAMFDRFVRVLLEAPHEKLINKLGV